MTINVNTGETVSLPYPSQAGVTLHRGSSGSIYAVAISPQPGNDDIQGAGETGGVLTSILRVNLANSAGSTRLVDFQGEDTQFSLAEAQGIAGGLAATIGGEGAAIYSAGGIQKIDRTGGFPLRILDGGQYLIKLDNDGNICWHDSRNGNILAVFRLLAAGWTLQTERGTASGRLH
jgi:hypothetical protein